MSSATLAQAEHWLAGGIAPIPIRARDKRPAREWLPYQTELPTYADLVSWFGNGSDLNLGVVCGWLNLAVLDFDTLERYSRWLRWAIQRGGVTENFARHTYQVRTGRGMHVYTYSRHRQRNRPLRGFGIDIKGAGGYVLAPPSIHPNGEQYTPFGRPDAPILLSSEMSDVLPAEMLIEAAQADPPEEMHFAPAPPPSSSDPWSVAANARDFDRARGLARIKGAFRIEDRFPQRVRSDKTGRWFLARCPLHEDRNPSFWIDTSRQLCGCHAGCTTKPMDYIDLFGRVCNISNEDAIRYLSRSLDGG